jgi:hypothetical protein
MYLSTKWVWSPCLRPSARKWRSSSRRFGQNFPTASRGGRKKKGWECVAIEFEFRSRNFERHRRDSNLCDLIVWWEHDWEAAPISVLALKRYIAQRRPAATPPTEERALTAPRVTRQTVLAPGGIKNGYINIKPLNDFWSEECRGGNVDRALQHLIIEFEGVRRGTTDISGRHKTLRCAYQEVKRFVAAHRLGPGDAVEIVRLGKYEYRIRPASG